MITEIFAINQRFKKEGVKPLLDFCGFKDITRSLPYVLSFLKAFFYIDFCDFSLNFQT
jgi:hypothetical protein